MSLNGPAAARLYDEHVDAVYAYAARRVGSELALQVVREVFEHALRRNAERPPQTGSDAGWLLALATAFLRRHGEAECRRLRNWTPAPKHSDRLVPLVTDPLLESDGEDAAARATARVMAAIAELDPVERDLVFLVAWEGCSSSLTAVATGIPAGDIRSRLARIRKEIRTRVATVDATSPDAGPISKGMNTANGSTSSLAEAPPAATAAQPAEPSVGDLETTTLSDIPRWTTENDGDGEPGEGDSEAIERASDDAETAP